MTTEDTSTTVDESTETTTEETGTAEESGTTTEQPTQRSVHELLKLSTFQGMTDAEIQSLIDYYVEVAHNDEYTRTTQATEIQTMNAQCAAYDSLRDDANSVLKQILSVPLNLAKIDENGEVVTE